jgi:hypothetical protein
MICNTCGITDSALICVGCIERPDLQSVLNPRASDEKTVAERKWQAGLKPAKPQQPCDIGLFSDEMDQVEMFMEPTNDMP